MLVCRGEAEDGIEVVFEAHGKHLVGFIKHDKFDAVKEEGFALGKVNETPRGSNEDMRGLLEVAYLRGDGCTTVNSGYAQAFFVLAKLLQLLADLLAELTGGSQYECLRLCYRCIYEVDERQSKSGGLASTGLCQAYKVLAGIDEYGYGLCLNGGGFVETQI